MEVFYNSITIEFICFYEAPGGNISDYWLPACGPRTART